MQVNIRLPARHIDISAIETELQALDPAGLVDLAGDGMTLRVSTSVVEAELAAILGNAGYPTALAQIERVPSMCCGGCGG